MARTVIGYDGRRPIYRDEGPARARAGDGGMGRFDLVEGLVHGDGRPSGAVERRQASDAQRAVWREQAAHVPKSPLERPPAPLRPRERPVTAEEATVVVDAGRELAELPCPGCAHAPVCSIKPLLEMAEIAVPRVDPAILVRVTIGCRYFLAAPESPELRQARAVEVVDQRRRKAEQPATSSDPEAIAERRKEAMRTQHATSPRHVRLQRDGAQRLEHEARAEERHARLTPKQQRAIELLREHDGSQSDVARRLGLSPGAVSSLVKAIRRRGRMPDDVERLLLARKRDAA